MSERVRVMREPEIESVRGTIGESRRRRETQMRTTDETRERRESLGEQRTIKRERAEKIAENETKGRKQEKNDSKQEMFVEEDVELKRGGGEMTLNQNNSDWISKVESRQFPRSFRTTERNSSDVFESGMKESS